MKSLIFSLILLSIALWGLGEFRISFFPFSLKMEKPYQFFGLIFLVIGLLLFQYQTEKDTQQRIYKQLQEELEKAVEQKVENNLNII